MQKKIILKYGFFFLYFAIYPLNISLNVSRNECTYTHSNKYKCKCMCIFIKENVEENVKLKICI